EVIVGSVAHVDAVEVGLAAELAIREKDFAGGKGTMMGVERYIAGITDESESGAAHAHRLREQRDLGKADLQGGSVHRNPAIGEGIDEGSGFGDSLGKTHGAGKDCGLIG